MSVEWLIPAMLTIVTAATPLVFAAVGETVVEKAGVLNLGVEGMMIIGAIAAFAMAVTTGSEVLAIFSGAIAGMLMAFIFGVLCVYLQSNQVATGLALTIFGLGLSALIGHSYVGNTFVGLAKLDIPGISDIPIVGPLVFGHDALVYFSILSVASVAWFLNKNARWASGSRSWRKPRCCARYRLFCNINPDGCNTIWRRYGRNWRSIPVNCLYAFVG